MKSADKLKRKIYSIFQPNHPSYYAKYGWQKYIDDSTFTFGYINSYKDAADTLVEEGRSDLLIFPIMFCYRQYLELLFKNICYKEMNDDEYKEFIRKSSHDLIKIWTSAKEILKINKEYKEYIDCIDALVKIFDKLDHSSMSFRYEYDKNLKRQLPDSLGIDTCTLMKVIDEIDTILRFTYDSE